jgi:predicted ATPase/DNA-binding SARP family transcriptional activator
VRFRDLGPVVVEVDGVAQPVGGTKPTAILAVLLVHANRRVPVDTLIDALWPDDAGVDRVSTLESHIWRLRRVLEPGRRSGTPPTVLLNDNGGYRLAAEAERIDSRRFEQLAAEVRELASAGSHELVLTGSDEALGLWRGRPYEVLADNDAVVPVVARLDELAAEVQERRIDALLELGETQRALADVVGLIEAAPFRERLWEQRMLGLYRAGRGEEALEAYRRARTALLDHAGMDPGPQLQQLHDRILNQDPALDAPRRERRAEEPAQAAAAPAAPLAAGPAERSRHGVPRRMITPLVGRGVDLARLSALVTEQRLVTVAGAAGCGKTRLTLEVAAAVAERFADGVWFADLASVEQPELVVDVVISAIGFGAPPAGTPLEALAAYMRDRRMLVVLDNCEHLLGAVADLAEAVLDAGTECCLLATTREPLGVDGEIIWPLGPLPVTAGDDDFPASDDDLGGALDDGSSEGDAPDPSPAMELFLARVSAVDPTIELKADDLRTAERICRAVDGVPLALELAAARIRSASIAEIAEHVTADPSGLRRLGRGQDDHRQSVRSAIEWSYRLLSNPEQAVHRRLSVLPGAFTRSAAVAVAGVEPVVPGEVPDVIAQLVHRSLLNPVRPRRAGGPTLYSQLATVRGHAAHALDADGESAASAQRRDEWVVELMSTRPRCSRPHEGWYETVDDAYATVRAALQQTLVDEPSPVGGRILSGLFMFWYFRGRTVEAQRWLNRAASLPQTRPIDLAATLLALGAHSLLRGRPDEATGHVERGLGLLLRLAAELGDGASRADGIDAAIADMAESLGSIALAAETQQQHGIISRIAAAVEQLNARIARDLDLLVEGLSCLTALGTGAPRGALAARAEAVHARGRAEGDALVCWIAATVLSAVAEDPIDGIRWTDEQGAMQVRMGGRDSGIFAERRAGFMLRAGQTEQAVELCSAARLYLRHAGLPWPLMPDTSDLLARARAELRDERFEQAWQRGELRPPARIMDGLGILEDAAARP